MKTLTMTKGLPGSGKSTWAIEQAKKPNVKRVNKDSLRAMIDGGQWSKQNEKDVLEWRDILINDWLHRGYNVICDDTNLAPVHEETLLAIALVYEAEFVVKSFLDVPIEECIRRDLIRPNSVGPGVIRKMHKQYLAEPEVVVPAPLWVTGKPRAIIVDIDGTIAIKGDRDIYDGSRAHLDTLNVPVVQLVWDWCLYHKGDDVELIFCSGRDAKYRAVTESWLRHKVLNEIPKTRWSLHMRPQGDTRKDSIVKTEIYHAEIEGKYNVAFVLDDRQQVVDAWRALGLTCLQVAPGQF